MELGALGHGDGTPMILGRVCGVQCCTFSSASCHSIHRPKATRRNTSADTVKRVVAVSSCVGIAAMRRAWALLMATVINLLGYARPVPGRASRWVEHARGG